MNWRSSIDKHLLFVLILAFLIRIATLYFIPTNPLSDSWSYFQRASFLADEGIYQEKAGNPDAAYPPGYPLVLSSVFHAFENRLLAAKLLNIGTSLASIFFLYLLTKQLFGKASATAAALLYTLSPRYFLLPLTILSENLFFPLLLAWVLYTLQQKSSYHSAIINGALLGCLTLIRSIAFLLILPWSIYQYLENSKKIKTISLICIALIAQLVVLLPWGLRNAKVLGQPTLLTTTSGINLFMGNNPNATGYWYPMQEDIRQIEPDFYSYSLVKQNKIARNGAVRLITLIQ